ILTAVGGNLADTVSLERGPDPTPGADEVVVEVEAAPINNGDMLFAAGLFSIFPPVPSAISAAGGGRILAAGSQVGPAMVGRRVVILPTFRVGTWATRTVMSAQHVIPVSEDADPLQLAMLSGNPATAYALLHDFVALRTGDWVGFNLANSAVGHYLIALARR